MKFHTILDHERPLSPCGSLSLTDQQYKDECDINVILSSYQVTHQPPVGRSGVFGDFSSVGDFVACMDKINRAKCEFDSLPSDIRSRFGNDPRSYVRFVLDPSNEDECVKLGLRVKPVVEDTPVDVLHRIEKVVTAPAKPA